MTRTIVDIPDGQLRDLDELCKLLGISRAEAVRQALRYFAQHNDDVKTDGFGLWTGTREEFLQRLEALRTRAGTP